jgi:hypothetical protein
MRVREINLAHLIGRLRLNRGDLLHKLREELHPLFAIFERHLLRDTGDDREVKIAFERAFEDYAVRIDERKLGSFAQKGDRRALGDLDFDSIGQRTAHAGVLNPGEHFYLATSLINRDSKKALAAIGNKDLAHALRANVVIAFYADLVGMKQSHSTRCEQEAAAFIRRRRASETDSGPGRHAQIRFPGLPAELSPLNFDRFLPAKVLRLFIRDYLLRIDFGVDRF